MIKVQLWENKTLFQANEGFEKPINGLVLESTFDYFKYLKENILKNENKKSQYFTGVRNRK